MASDVSECVSLWWIFALWLVEEIFFGVACWRCSVVSQHCLSATYSHVSLCAAVILDLVVLTSQEAVTLATVQCTRCVIVVSQVRSSS